MSAIHTATSRCGLPERAAEASFRLNSFLDYICSWEAREKDLIGGRLV